MGETVFANPGPLKEGHAVLAELTGDKTTARLVDFSEGGHSKAFNIKATLNRSSRR